MSAEKIKEWLKAAKQANEKRLAEGVAIADDISRKYEAEKFDVKKLIELVPGTNQQDDPNKLVDDEEYESSIRRDGFTVTVINPDLYHHSGTKIAIKKPLPIWLRRVQEGTFVEALGCPEAHAVGKDEKSAIASLLLILKESLVSSNPEPMTRFARSYIDKD